MPNSQVMPLHWGLVDRTIDVFNVDPMSRIIPPIKGGGIEKTIASGSSVARVSGGGNTRKVTGSGRVKSVRGSGRLCP